MTNNDEKERLTRIRMENRTFPAKWTVVLFIVLHYDQASDAECVVAAELDRSPLYLHAHGTRVVVDLGHMRQDLCVYFCADGFGQVL